MATTSPGKRAKIQLLMEDGKSERAIAARLQMPKTTVHDVIQHIKSTGTSAAGRSSGRPRCTTSKTDAMIRRAATKDPLASSSQILNELPPDVNVSSRTIRRRLVDDFSLRSYRAALKPRLSQKNIRDRLKFCKAHKNWTVAMWRRVMFSDESQVKQFATHKVNVRRPPNTRYNARYVAPAVKHCPAIMIWGAITARGRAGIYLMPPGETIKAVNYLQIIKENVPIWLRTRNCDIFMHDGAPCHQAKIVKTWFQENSINVLAPWPGSSPDLNPIENCWVKLKAEVAKANSTSATTLKEAILEAWSQKITPDYCDSLVASMPRRIEAVLKAGGRHSRY